MILENQRYGRNKSTLVNKSYIESGEYKRKYDNATDNQEVNKTLYDCAKTALKHRSGTVFEDMYWIDSETGKIVLSVTDSKDERAIIYTDKIRNTIENSPNIITLHTHPSSMPPSISDLNSCCANNYKVGFVACQDGSVFAYSSTAIINDHIYNMYIRPPRKLTHSVCQIFYHMAALSSSPYDSMLSSSALPYDKIFSHTAAP